MTFNTSGEGDRTNPANNEVITTRDRMMGEATVLAEMLAGRGNVARVGIAGSLARGKENPSDIDFVIFTDNETAKACHREKMRLLRQGSDQKVQLSKYLTLDDASWNSFAAAYSHTESGIDIQVVSNEPDEVYIRMMANDNIDPNFLINISKDALLYDPSAGVFKKSQVFGETRTKMMEEASFERLKEILSEPNGRFYETVISSHSHQKRSAKAIGGEPDSEESKSKMAIVAKEKAETSRLQVYTELIRAADENPFSQDLWDKVIKLVKDESRTYDGSEEYYLEDLSVSNIYDQIPLSDLIRVGNRLREATSRQVRYQILMETDSYGELWYDIILGHVNDKMFQPVVDKITSSGEKLQKGLDVGCGSGNSLKMMAPYFQECVGVDKQFTALEVAKGYDLPANTTLVNGDATKLPLAEETFDLATSNGLTYYLTKPQIRKYVEEIDRVLKPGGNYHEAVATIKEGHIMPGFEEDYLLSAKSVLVCILDRMCTHLDETETARNPTTVLINGFKELGYKVRFSGFGSDDLGVLSFYKSGETAQIES